jgi:hypothetical protein
MFKLIKILFFTPGPIYSWKKVALVVCLASLAISGSAAASYFFYRFAKQQQNADAASAIRAIVQTTSQSGRQCAPLQTAYLAEVLGLSADLHLAKKRLLATCVIKEAVLKKMKPDALFIQYSTRVPYAFLEDYTNTAIDEEGVFFPFTPFYSPRSIPRIYLGKVSATQPWGGKIREEHLMLIQRLFTTLGVEKIERIDLSQMEANSAGRRELVVILKGGSILRLSPKNYVQQLANYSILKRTFLRKADPAVVDLRIPEVAYIQVG